MSVFMKGLFIAVLVICLFGDMPSAMASAEKILFIPHDDRPISYSQTVEVIREAGYEMILPPRELLARSGDIFGCHDQTICEGCYWYVIGRGQV